MSSVQALSTNSQGNVQKAPNVENKGASPYSNDQSAGNAPTSEATPSYFKSASDKRMQKELETKLKEKEKEKEQELVAEASKEVEKMLQVPGNDKALQELKQKKEEYHRLQDQIKELEAKTNRTEQENDALRMLQLNEKKKRQEFENALAALNLEAIKNHSQLAMAMANILQHIADQVLRRVSGN